MGGASGTATNYSKEWPVATLLLISTCRPKIGEQAAKCAFRGVANLIPVRITCLQLRMVSGGHGTLSCSMRLKPGLGLIAAAIVTFAMPGARAGDGNPPPSAKPSLSEIIAGMQARSRAQSQNLKQYHALRTYNVEYHGLGTMSARMQVEITYDSARGKSFHIVSQSGSLLLRDAVLKRAVDSEREASKEKGATDLSPANYRFRLAGVDSVNGQPAYILDVEPLKPQKFLYRGSVWVDAASFGVVKIQAAPAKNPSFWISKTTIWVTNAVTDGFWLPQLTRSQTAVRMGGTATLTIDYGRYVIGEPVPSTAELPGQNGK